MKQVIIALLFISSTFLFSCQKEKKTQVMVNIEYIGSGGYYNDNIEGVPSGLVIGENGPFPADPDKTYTIEYQADENFPVITKEWSPTGGPWTIHCYVTGNTEYIQVTPGF